MWRRKLLTAFTFIIALLWWGSGPFSRWYTVRKPATGFSLVFDSGGILVQHIVLKDAMRNAPGTEIGAGPGPFNDIMIADEPVLGGIPGKYPYFLSSIGLLNVPSRVPWKCVVTTPTEGAFEMPRVELEMLDGDGRNFYLPYWFILLMLLILWLRPHRKKIIQSIRQKWRAELRSGPPILDQPSIDQGPRPAS